MKKISIDISKDQQDELCIHGRNDCVNENGNFFYDETNNHRRFWLNTINFNASIKLDFVLGGVVYWGDSFKGDVDELKTKVRLPKNCNEIKFKHLVKKGSGFLECLKSKKIKIFLEWLDSTNLYIHKSNINNFYYGIVDIIDSIYDDNEAYDYGLIHQQMKNELYVFAINHYDDFFNFLKKFNYPNVDDEKVSEFCDEMLKLISNNCNTYNIPLEILKQMLKVARNKKELIFLRNNKEDTVIENYYTFYLRPISLFKNSVHVFDEEYEVQKEIDKFEFYDNGELMNNYVFENSQNNELIQVSDCIIGLIGKYYNYVNEVSDNEIDSLDEKLTEEQKSTLNLFAKLIFKSEVKCKYLLHSCESIYEHSKSADILKWAIEYDKRKRILEFLESRAHDIKNMRR